MMKLFVIVGAGMSEEKDPYKLYGIKPLKLLEHLFPPPPYNCAYRRTNPDLLALCEPDYQDNYSQLVSDSGVEFPVYQCYCEMTEETTTLTVDEWLEKPVRPSDEIVILKEEISDALKIEGEVGIHHYTGHTDWVQPTLNIPVPQLVARVPYDDAEVKPGDKIDMGKEES